MNHREVFIRLNVLLNDDLGDSSLMAFALRTVLTEIIKVIRSLDVNPTEAVLLQKRNSTLAALNGLLMREVEEAVNSESGSRGQKSTDKARAARADYRHAHAAVERALHDFILVLKQHIA
jgi:hypothetical protein